MKAISISGVKFEVTTPYAAGHTLNDIEAKVLNQTRAENIGNNFRKAVKDAGEDQAALAEVAAQLAAYDAEYHFSAGGVARTPVDPIEAEAIKIAKEVVKVKISERYGVSIKKYLEVEGNADKYEAAVDKIATQEDTLKLAKKRVADKKKSLEVANEDLGL